MRSTSTSTNEGERTPVQGNPGFAGETGHFSQLTEAEVRGSAYIGERPPEG